MAATQFALHGHFYQPERTIPEIHKIPDDEAAKARSGGKFNNWNEVINDECYRPNAELGNFTSISFDVYRTIFDWIKVYDPKTYRHITDQVQTVKQKEGYCNIFAGPYDHAILPLLKSSDIETEIYWGVTDFLHRFGFKPTGFWLPETAVNNRVLKELADNDIKLTILAPWQAKTSINTNLIYDVRFSDESKISCAFYHEQTSQALSFDNNAMISADGFADAYLRPLDGQQFVLAATDGERYGHHLQGGAEFLHQLMTSSSKQKGLEPVTITKYYHENPPKDIVEIAENSSWSCLHGGLQRWRADCDCNYDFSHNARVSGAWKTTLYNSLKYLADEIDIFYEAKLIPLLHDPRLAKKTYIHVLLGELNKNEFLADHQTRPLTSDEEVTVLTLLDMQRYKLASFTSCGFFFADIDRPEPRINIHNAKKTIQLLRQLRQDTVADMLEQQFLQALESIKSNFTGVSGKDVYYEYSNENIQ